MFAREVPFQSNTINMYRLDPHPKASPSALVTPIAPLCLFLFNAGTAATYNTRKIDTYYMLHVQLQMQVYTNIL